MAGWRHWLNGHEFEQSPGNSEGQGSQVCWIHRVTKSQTRLSDWTTTIDRLQYLPCSLYRELHEWCMPYFQQRNSMSNVWTLKSESEVAQSSPTLCNPMNLPARLLHPRDFPGKITGVSCYFLLQGIEPRSPALQADSLPSEPQGKYIINHIFPLHESSVFTKLKWISVR